MKKVTTCTACCRLRESPSTLAHEAAPQPPRHQPVSAAAVQFPSPRPRLGQRRRELCSRVEWAAQRPSPLPPPPPRHTHSLLHPRCRSPLRCRSAIRERSRRRRSGLPRPSAAGVLAPPRRPSAAPLPVTAPTTAPSPLQPPPWAVLHDSSLQLACVLR